MRVSVNGTPHEVAPGTTILQFLQERGVDVRAVAVAHNEAIVHRSSLGEVQLADGDVLEIIKVVAGG